MTTAALIYAPPGKVHFMGVGGVRFFEIESQLARSSPAIWQLPIADVTMV